MVKADGSCCIADLGLSVMHKSHGNILQPNPRNRMVSEPTNLIEDNSKLVTKSNSFLYFCHILCNPIINYSIFNEFFYKKNMCGLKKCSKIDRYKSRVANNVINSSCKLV